MKIDLKALDQAAKGNPKARVSVKRVWIGTVADELEGTLYDGRRYDTSALRIMSQPTSDKVEVDKTWLRHIHTVLSQSAVTEVETNIGSKVENLQSAMKEFDGMFAKFNQTFDRMFRDF